MNETENEHTPLLQGGGSGSGNGSSSCSRNRSSNSHTTTNTVSHTQDDNNSSNNNINNNINNNSNDDDGNGDDGDDMDPVTFAPGDQDNPRNWPESRKWVVVAPIVLVDLAVSWGASGYSPAMADFMEDMGLVGVEGEVVGTLGLSLYVLGLALGPMSLAPLSEYYGRSPLYVVPFGMYVLWLMATALVPGVVGFMVLRVLSGLSAGVTIANLGGTIADLWPRHRVGVPVSWWMWAAVGGSPSGFFLMSLVAQSRGWRDVFWALTGICGGFWLLMTVVLLAGDNETRHSVILRRRAARLRREKNTNKVDIPEEIKQRSLGKLFKVTLTRPFRLLFSELIIVFAAIYNGYLYGLSFLFNGAYHLVFGPMGYGFDTLQVGLVFLAFFLGVCAGPLTYYLWQERYYQKRIHMDVPESHNGLRPDEDGYYKNIPEARVQISKVAAVGLPVSLWWFAWTCVPEYNIHWIVPVLATSLFGWSFYTLIMMTYLYTEDSYMVFSASALAGVGMVRNLAGAGFPLFGRQLFLKEGYNWAGTILACLSMLLIPIPFVLERYGVKLRARSPWARHAMDEYKGRNEGNSSHS